MRLTETHLRKAIRSVIFELLTRRREKDPETGGTKDKDSWLKHSLSRASGHDAWKYGPDDAEYGVDLGEADEEQEEE